jgi:TPR repeat protein
LVRIRIPGFSALLKPFSASAFSFALVAILLSSQPASADFEDGVRAFLRGDYATAHREWLPLALGGSADAQFALGALYRDGYGVEDYVEAAKWYRRAALQGHAGAQNGLGEIYRLGLGVAQDHAEALKWHRRAADQGLSDSQFWLGVMYAIGQGMQKDLAEAANWHRRAAEQGHALAQYTLGLAYEVGAGVPKDYTEALKWYRRAADQGDPEAQFAIGKMYSAGRGVSADKSEGAEWNRRAAQQGHGDAQFYMGVLYFLGEAVPQDFLLAHMWLNLAASNSTTKDHRAAEFREIVGRRLTPAQLAATQQMAREWKVAQERTTERPRPLPSFSSAPSSGAPKAIKMESTGTGFLVSKSGHILTSSHVVKNCHEIRTRTHDGRGGPTPVMASDPKNDLALLSLSSRLARPAGVATLREGRGIRQGDGVLAIGFPLRGLLASGVNLTTGTISALAGLRDDTRYLQITAPIQPGNSGGPLLDQSGNVIGIIVAKLDAVKIAEATGDIPQNVNFAINATMARPFLDANGVEYETAPSTRKLEAADIGERAKKFTVLVECWK